jgi:hypothetical protein
MRLRLSALERPDCWARDALIQSQIREADLPKLITMAAGVDE